jgi:lipid-binding SYLF domain-containing protein
MKQIAVLMFFAMVPTFAANDAVKRLQESAEVLSEVMATPDRAIPQDLLNSADCIVVVPGVKKAAFIVGAKYGRGFITCRHDNGVGWSAPGAIRVEGGSFGFQIGGSETDVIMVIRNRRGAEKLMKDKFTLGADASVAGGPVGRTSAAQTDAMMHAEILTWSRSRGVFAGLSLDGATLRPDDDTNRDLYGSSMAERDIVFGNTPPPAGAKPLLTELNRYSSRKG